MGVETLDPPKWKRKIVAHTNAGGLAAATCKPGHKSDLVKVAEAVRASTGVNDFFERVEPNGENVRQQLDRAHESLPDEGKLRLEEFAPRHEDVSANLLKKEEPPPDTVRLLEDLVHNLIEAPSTVEDHRFAEFVFRLGEWIAPYAGGREKAAELFFNAACMLNPSMKSRIEHSHDVAKPAANQPLRDNAVADAAWALKEWGDGKFAEYPGWYVAVYRRKVVGDGNDPVELVAQSAKDNGVSEDRIVIKYNGPED